MFREYKHISNARILALKKGFEREKDDMVHFMGKKKKRRMTKQISKLIEETKCLSHEARDTVLNNYFEICRHFSIINFVLTSHWFR